MNKNLLLKNLFLGNNWLVNTGDLRQIGKTTTLIEASRISAESSPHITILCVATRQQANSVCKIVHDGVVVISHDELSTHLNFVKALKKRVNLFVDDGRFGEQKILKAVQEHSACINSKRGWY